MKAKTKKIFLWSAVGVAVLMGYKRMAQSSTIKSVASTASNGLGAITGNGKQALLDELGAWFDSPATNQEKADFMNQAIPNVTQSDLEAYWNGAKAGEIPNYTEQDQMLIEQVVVW